MVCLAIQSILMASGVWIFPLRCISMFCQTLFCAMNFGTVITLSVFRFNTIGKLASLSLEPSAFGTNASTGLPALVYTRTYADDG